MRNGILIISNGKDVSDNLVWNSLSKNEALNNNKNTCSFSLYDKKLTENDDVYIYDYVINIQPINIGEDFFYANDTYQIEEKYKVGDYIYIDILGENIKKQIKSVDPVTNKITLTEIFTQSIPVKSYHGSLFFAGVIDNIEEKIVSKSSTEIEYEYEIVGFEKLMDRKVVIDSYISQYLMEVIGRILFKFVANDSELPVFDFETGLTGTGLCNNSTNYGTEKIVGNFCQKCIATGNGSRTKTISSIDISSYSDLRFWWKIKVEEGKNIGSMKFRIGTNSSNYFEWDMPHAGQDREDCWIFENFKIKYPDTIQGSPDLTNITRLSFSYEGNTINYLLFDSMFVSTGGMTMGPVKRGTIKVDDVRFKGIQPSVVFETLTKNFNHFWYVDHERSIHYYYQDGEGTSAFQITPTERKYTNLNVTVDTTQIINRQLVEGSEAPAETIYTQQKKADGVQTSFTLDFKPAGERKYPDGTIKQGLKVFVNNIEKSVGLEGLADESVVDFVYSFQEKNVRNASFPLLSNTDVIKFTYYPYKTISVRYADMASINLMKNLIGGDGIFEGRIIIDKTIESIQIARQRAMIEVKTKKDPIVTYTFTTDIGVGIGKMVRVIDPSKGVDDYFQVQKVSARSRAGNMFTYTISITKKFFDYVEFFQLLFKKANNFQVNQNVQVIIPGNVDETISIRENYTIVSVSDVYRAGMLYTKFFRFNDMIGTTNVAGFIGDKNQNWLLEGIGSASVQTISGYNNSKVLELSTNSSAKMKTILHEINGNIPIKVSYDVKINSQSGTGNIKIFFNEYSSDRILIESHELTIDKNLPDFVSNLIELTTKSNIAYYSVGVSVESLTADIYLGAINIQDQSTNTIINQGIASFSFAS